MVGWREWITLPELGGVTVKAKIDTGARTSALHAWKITPVSIDGVDCVSFELHPLQHDNQTIVNCVSPLVDHRVVKSSSGHRQHRYVISTLAQLGDYQWHIELSLTRRDEMGFRMLLGRAALSKRFLVDPGRSFLAGRLD